RNPERLKVLTTLRHFTFPLSRQLFVDRLLGLRLRVFYGHMRRRWTHLNAEKLHHVSVEDSEVQPILMFSLEAGIPHLRNQNWLVIHTLGAAKVVKVPLREAYLVFGRRTSSKDILIKGEERIEIIESMRPFAIGHHEARFKNVPDCPVCIACAPYVTAI